MATYMRIGGFRPLPLPSLAIFKQTPVAFLPATLAANFYDHTTLHFVTSLALNNPGLAGTFWRGCGFDGTFIYGIGDFGSGNYKIYQWDNTGTETLMFTIAVGGTNTLLYNVGINNARIDNHIFITGIADTTASPTVSKEYVYSKSGSFLSSYTLSSINGTTNQTSQVYDANLYNSQQLNAAYSAEWRNAISGGLYLSTGDLNPYRIDGITVNQNYVFTLENDTSSGLDYLKKRNKTTLVEITNFAIGSGGNTGGLGGG